MYGALRTRANNSTHLAGVTTAALITALAGYALANGFAMDLARIIETPITFTPLPEETLSDQPMDKKELVMSDTPRIETPLPLGPTVEFKWDPEVITGTTTRATDPGPATNANATPAPKPVRSRPSLLSRETPSYPPSAIRTNSEGISTLDVCVDAKGRVTSATIISGSGHAVLDNAALKWVRSARFSPGKLDGAPQSVCGHTIVYEWKLEDARR